MRNFTPLAVIAFAVALLVPAASAQQGQRPPQQDQQRPAQGGQQQNQQRPSQGGQQQDQRPAEVQDGAQQGQRPAMPCHQGGQHQGGQQQGGQQQGGQQQGGQQQGGQQQGGQQQGGQQQRQSQQGSQQGKQTGRQTDGCQPAGMKKRAFLMSVTVEGVSDETLTVSLTKVLKGGSKKMREYMNEQLLDDTFDVNITAKTHCFAADKTEMDCSTLIEQFAASADGTAAHVLVKPSKVMGEMSFNALKVILTA